MSLNNIIIKIFKSHGFEINSSSDYSKYILASKDNINLSIGYSDINDEVNMAEMRNFFRAAKKDNAHRFIYIIPTTKYPYNIGKFADDRNIQLWTRERLERELGRAVLVNLEAEGDAGEFTEDLTTISETGSDSMIFPDDLPTDASLSSEPGISSSDSGLGTSGEDVPIMVPIIPFDDDGELITATSPASTAEEPPIIDASAEESLSTIQPSDTTTAPENKEVWVIKPNVTKDQAAGMANKIVRGFRFNLELIPYYIFSYKCTFETDTAEPKTNSGIIGINGLTSNIEEWRGNLKTIRYLEEEHTKLEIKFPYDKAVSLAHEAVVELNTTSVETREESDSTVIFEKKRLKPKSDAIEIHSKGLYYLPVWCIEGSNGLMIIDASSGKVIKEDIF
ncbi:hypothetical protein [[Eubacterium] cellulosolvens]